MIRARVTNPATSTPLTARGERKGRQKLTATRQGLKLASFENSSGLGDAYLINVIRAIEAVADSLAESTAEGRARAAAAFMQGLTESDSEEAARLRNAAATGCVALVDSRVANAFELQFREHLVGAYGAGTSTLAGKIHDVNATLRMLSSRGLWPHTLRLPPEPIDPDKTDVRPSLLESIGRTTTRSRDLRGFETRKIAAAAGLQWLDISMPAQPDLQPDAILLGERACVERLKTAARAVFAPQYAAWAAMQPLIADCQERAGEQLMDWLVDLQDSVARLGRSPSLERQTTALFPGNEVGLSRFLAALNSAFMCGQESTYLNVPEADRTRFNLALRHAAYRVRPALAPLNLSGLEPLEAIRGLLTPSRVCVGAAAVMLALETGMNTAPIIDLPWSQVLGTDDPHWISLANWKERARGSLIEEEIELSSPGAPTSAARALMQLREMSARHSSFLVMPKDAVSLAFVHAAGHVGEAEQPLLAPMTETTFNGAFASIASATFGKERAPTPSNVRPSLLTLARGTSRSIKRAQLAASHKGSDTTFNRYAGKTLSGQAALHMSMIRDFQDRLEQIAAHNLDGAVSSVEQASAAGLEDAVRSGLGSLCLQKAEPDSEEGRFDCIENCPNCNRVKISTDPEDLADLLAFGDHLEANEDWLQTHRPEAWFKHWLFWSLLIAEVQRRGTRSAWAGNLKKARELHATRPAPSFPPLW